MTDLLLIWLIVYVLPAALAYGAAVLFSDRKSIYQNNLFMHVALLVSICAFQYATHAYGIDFPWQAPAWSLMALAAGSICAAYLIGGVGLLYAGSAFIQELAMCSVVFLLATAFPTYLIILLVMPVFVACHFLSLEQWRLRLPLFVAWGVASVLLFLATQNVYLIAGLHAALGATLVRLGVIYSEELHIR